MFDARRNPERYVRGPDDRAFSAEQERIIQQHENENMPVENQTDGADVSAQPEPQRELTFGEKAVGLSFNPSGDSLVQAVKERYAVIIDAIDTLRARAKESNNSEAVRLFSIAITEAQGAQMWAVKAITWK